MNQPENLTVPEANGAGKRTAIETVHAQIRERVISGAFKPGERLHVDKLRQEFGVSTSTMREAISRLLIDSLVTSEQQRGFRVAPLSLKDFRDITDARKVIEAQALRVSLANRSEEWEAELVGAFHRLSTVEQKMIGEGQRDLASAWDERNAGFHDCLVKNCNNAWLIRFRRTLHQHSYRYHRMLLGDTSLRRDVRTEHRAIFDTAMAGETDRCVALIEEHIETSYRDLISQHTLD
ncbi:GntR family transcriptional regulator [Salipiger sp. P9]|uniref:GntR family transcriptional regulator n=1 Tax=Salipiger pentaromativorans TaxID=2943193 RepID=UPI0021571F51|nr:GntR family transcriptional regulator [Salipiger pentaromativorans]MCR8547406.1 GntR family transcriptional regulator [Salipiger pentaromativorans]